MKKEHYLISFIIPLWNRENTICYCLDSILCQAKLCPFEIIVVDDASTDSSNLILQKLIGKDSYKCLKDTTLSCSFPETIRLFDKLGENNEMRIRSRIRLITCTNNLGAANARNLGLEAAIGDYIWFVDSDDFIASKSLKYLSHILCSKKYDILCFSTQKFSYIPQAYQIKNLSSETKELNTHNVNDLLFMLSTGTVWSRLYNRHFIYSYRFNTEFSYSEDSQFVWNTTLNANNVVYLKRTMYGYMYNANSLTSKKNYERFRCYIQVVEEYISAIKRATQPIKNKEALIKECEKRLYYHAFYTFEYHEITGEMWGKWYEVYYNVMVKNSMRKILKRALSLFIIKIHSNKLFFHLFKITRTGKLNLIL